jgi:hypothetical protein
MIQRPSRPGQPVNTTIAGHVRMVVPAHGDVCPWPTASGLRWKSTGVNTHQRRGEHVVAWTLRPFTASMTPRQLVAVTVLSGPYQFVEIEGDWTRLLVIDLTQ